MPEFPVAGFSSVSSSTENSVNVCSSVPGAKLTRIVALPPLTSMVAEIRSGGIETPSTLWRSPVESLTVPLNVDTVGVGEEGAFDPPHDDVASATAANVMHLDHGEACPTQLVSRHEGS